MRIQTHWFDRVTAPIAPRWTLQRQRARVAAQLLQRHYEAASVGRRTQGWNRSSSDANSANGTALSRLRDSARDLVRNNGQMKQALKTIANHTVGWGIVAKPRQPDPSLVELWKAWAETAACDADGRDDLYGLQKLVIRGVAEGGEMLVRRRFRRLDDGLPVPLQLQVLEPDFIDTSKTLTLPNGGQIVQGVEFDALGRRVAYWLFGQHPGSSLSSTALLSPSRRIQAAEILHVFERERAGQVRAVSWFAPILLPAKDLDEYGDAQLMKQKIAACLAVLISDVDGTASPLGTADTTTTPETDQLEPGMIMNVPPGRNIEVVQPPTVGEYGAYQTVEQRKLAKGLGLSYEDFSGDYSNVNFSSARMARLEHYDNVYDWRWRLMVPQFCNPVWSWFLESALIAGLAERPVGARWTAPPIPMIEPDKEGLAVQRNIRTGIITGPEAVRERGYDVDEFLDEVQEWNRKLDERGIILDSDPRRITQQGQTQAAAKSDAPATNTEAA